MSKIIQVPGDRWISLHDSAGMVAGTPVAVQNQGIYAVRLAQSAEEPVNEDGALLDTLPSSQSFAIVTGAGQLWAKAVSGGPAAAPVFVQEM